MNLSAHAGLPETIEQIKPSIVGIGTYLATRRQPHNLGGTGFVVADGRHLITNYHVVSKIMSPNTKERYVVFIGHGARSKVVSVRQVALDKQHDLALLKFDAPALPAMKINSRINVREGERYAFTGFPIGAVLGLHPATHTGIISAITPFAMPANVDSQLNAFQIKQLRDQKPYNVYQLEAVAYPGNSGSPLYDIRRGEVIGVINSVVVKKSRESALAAPSGISYAIPALYIEKLIQQITK